METHQIRDMCLDPDMSLRDIGRRLHISHEKARQIRSTYPDAPSGAERLVRDRAKRKELILQRKSHALAKKSNESLPFLVLKSELDRLGHTLSDPRWLMGGKGFLISINGRRCLCRYGFSIWDYNADGYRYFRVRVGKKSLRGCEFLVFIIKKSHRYIFYIFSRKKIHRILNIKGLPEASFYIRIGKKRRYVGKKRPSLGAEKHLNAWPRANKV